MTALTRLEFWTDVEPANGQRLAIINNWVACRETRSLSGDDVMLLTLLRDNPALETLDTPAGQLNARAQNVLRAVYDEGSVVERRIETVPQQDNAGDVRVSLTARGMLHELGLRGMAFRENQKGERDYHFQASRLTPLQHITNYLLPALLEGGQPWWAAGLIEVADPVTVVYDGDSVLSALRKIISASISTMELQVRYDQATRRYLIDLLGQVGGTAEAVRVRTNVNLLSMGIEESAADVVNRCFGFGATDEELARASLAGNAWRIGTNRTDAAGGVWLKLIDPAGGPGPIAFDGQYGVTPEGQHRMEPALQPTGSFGRPGLYITDSLAASQEVKVVPYTTGGTTPTPNLLYRLFHGTRTLAYVEAPASRADLGVRIGSIERPDAPAVLNLISNPMARLLNPAPTARYPLGWSEGPAGLGTNGISVTLETNPVYWRTGGRAVRVTFSQLDTYVFVNTDVLQLSSGRLSFFADVMTLVGAVRTSMSAGIVLSTMPNGVVRQVINYPSEWLTVFPTTPADLIPSTQNEKTGDYERLGLDGVHDCIAYPLDGSTLIRIEPVVVPCTVVIDAAQVTNTKTNRDLIEGTGSNLLLQLCNERLVRYEPLAVTLSVDALDLATVDDDQFPFNNYTLGGAIQVFNDRLDTIIQTRVMGWDRDWMVPEQLSIQISNARPDITRVLSYQTPSQPPAGGA